MSETNGKPLDGAPIVGNLKYTLKVTYDLCAEEFEVDGLNIPPWVALGMLRYMEILVRRREFENTIAASARNAPRIAVPGGLL